MGFNNGFCQEQPQTSSLRLAAEGIIQPGKLLKDAVLFMFRDANALIADGNGDMLGISCADD